MDDVAISSFFEILNKRSLKDRKAVVEYILGTHYELLSIGFQIHLGGNLNFLKADFPNGDDFAFCDVGRDRTRRLSAAICYLSSNEEEKWIEFLTAIEAAGVL